MKLFKLTDNNGRDYNIVSDNIEKAFGKWEIDIREMNDYDTEIIKIQLMANDIV